MTDKTICNRVNKKILELTKKNFRDDNWMAVYDVVCKGIKDVLDKESTASYENEYELNVWVDGGGYVYDRDGYFCGKEYQLEITNNGNTIARGHLRACPSNNTVDKPFEFSFYEISGYVYATKQGR